MSYSYTRFISLGAFLRVSQVNFNCSHGWLSPTSAIAMQSSLKWIYTGEKRPCFMYLNLIWTPHMQEILASVTKLFLHRENGEPRSMRVLYLHSLNTITLWLACGVHIKLYSLHSSDTLPDQYSDGGGRGVNSPNLLYTMSQDQQTPVKSQLCSGNFYLYVTI